MNCKNLNRNNKEYLAEYLPLKIWTPPEWAKKVLENPVELLADHAQLERKAAANALALMHRWPPKKNKLEESSLAHKWLKTLTQIAQDETAHLELVLEHIRERSGEMPRFHENNYAKQLRACEHAGSDPNDLVDRLLVSSLIEARSCERFYLLSEATEDPKLKKLYKGLWSSEHGHYLEFLNLAIEVQDQEIVTIRWEEMLKHEAQIIQAQAAQIKIHSWIT
jgi:tRNA-(ms[2]io[6]A)-hydroxylase